MSLNSILGTASSGLFVSQTGINAVSDNVANVNTPGYVRKVVNQSTQAQQGLGSGCRSPASRAANQYLQNASLAAAAQVGQSGAVSDILGQAQALFGDPSGSDNLFGALNQVFSDFTAAANDPANNLNATQAVNDATTFLNQAKGVSSQLTRLSSQADGQITSDVAQANQLLTQIAQLNGNIVQATAMGGDATDAQNAQGALINQLSSLMDVRVSTGATGAVSLSTTTGVTLIGQAGASTLSYTAGVATSQITITQPGVNQPPTNLDLASGEIQGLLSLRNDALPGVQDQLSEFVSGAVTAINAAHNGAAAVPPPQTLTGAATGVDLQTAIGAFSGKTSIAVVNASGVRQQQVDIDFSAGTMTVNGAAGPTFTAANFLTSLNTALGGKATASFTNGALSISATASTNGVALVDDATTPSSRNGEGFSQYFGLNNLIGSTGVTNYQTGLKATDPSGFPAGQQITLRIADATGSQITDVTVTTPGGTVQNLINSLNAVSGGVGLYGQFSLDAAGALTFSPNSPGAVGLSVVKDQTVSTAGSVSASQLFGIGADQRGMRTNTFSVRSDIQANPGLLSLATLNLGVAAGQPVLSVGDGSGGLKLAKATNATVAFGSAGYMAAMNTTVSRYASLLGGQLGNDASAAATASSNAKAVQTEADTRRSSVEGVSLDQELVNLTTYQQAYSASARLITATKDMFTTLLNMVGN